MRLPGGRVVVSPALGEFVFEFFVLPFTLRAHAAASFSPLPDLVCEPLELREARGDASEIVAYNQSENRRRLGVQAGLGLEKRAVPILESQQDIEARLIIEVSE